MRSPQASSSQNPTLRALRNRPSNDPFVDEIRTFLHENLTPELRRAGTLSAGIYADQPVAVEWLRILNARGWAVPAWPVEYGGTGWNPAQLAIFERELTLANAPAISPNAIRMVGPVVMRFGTQAQKEHYLPRIRSGEHWWAQGYSEPGAGSDLASLRCQAVRDGEHYVINGTKIWTTHAQWSNRIFCLVRTRYDGKPQQGITFLLFDLKLPGITIKPLISISGDHELNQVFFDNVRVPVDAVLGSENEGWTVAKYLLQHERGSRWTTGLRVRLEHVMALCQEVPSGSSERPLSEDRSVARGLSATLIELDAFAAFEDRLFAALDQGETTGALSSLLKVRGTELRQRITEHALEAAAYYGSPRQPAARDPYAPAEPIGPAAALTAMPQYLNDRAATIYAGSNEVQRNILAKAVLEL